MENILEVKNLSKKFADFAIDNLTFNLPSGYIMGFIGPNGAGKTTTIKLILGMLLRDGGDVSLFGRDAFANSEEIKERIGVVLDKPFYVEEWTLSAVGKSLAPFYKKWNAEKFSRMLSHFSLDPKKKVKELSRGMAMKLMIAAALSHDADLLILDEPTSGLDVLARNELTDILSGFIADENKSVLFSTHITADLEKIADYITFINDGRILYSDTKDGLMEKFRIVKGGLGQISPEQKKMIIGYREFEVGFDGLIDSSKIHCLPPSVLTEQSSLDEIVLRFNTGVGEKTL